MACTNIPTTLLLILFLFPFLLLLPPALWRALIATPSSIDPQFLAAHNKVRARHKLPPLEWSTGLARYAKWYADERSRDCALYSSGGDFGENILLGIGKQWKAADVVAAWVAEEAYYDYKSNSCMEKKQCSRYTQVVWRKTVKVGCAQVECGSGHTYVVCEYCPSGNVKVRGLIRIGNRSLPYWDRFYLDFQSCFDMYL